MKGKNVLNRNLRKKLAYLILLIFLPVYIIIAVSIMNYLGQLNIWIELIIYILLGVLWIFPFKFIFKGLASR
ncbi:MAG: hypothetical protein CML72_03230 [Rhodobacterales bacterium]|nr:hypothetical protein [Rhodobacterales bacterium]